MILGVFGVAAINGVIPGGMSGTVSDAPHKTVGHEPIRTPPEPSKCPLCGTIESIRTLELRVAPDDAEPAGVSGAADTGPIGRENDSTTILETVAKAVTGSGGRKNVYKRLAYRITVRMDDGSYRTVSQPSPPALAVGDKVRVVEGRLVRT